MRSGVPSSVAPACICIPLVVRERLQVWKCVFATVDVCANIADNLTRNKTQLPLIGHPKARKKVVPASELELDRTVVVRYFG